MCSETTEWTFVLVHFMTDMTKVKRERGRGRRKGQDSKGRREKGKGFYIVASRHLCVGNMIRYLINMSALVRLLLMSG
ncbi:hypothetical protein HYQ46_012442 [Verticillium longisporum]|nr:hypothetical protein HYQ44_018469 [Verticillium longisporum]KAG7151766.1 hypothetical protein HYQ46_012442 [Verticillium longisporum]